MKSTTCTCMRYLQIWMHTCNKLMQLNTYGTAAVCISANIRAMYYALAISKKELAAAVGSTVHCSNKMTQYVVVSTLALINEVNLRRTRLVLRWVTVSSSIPGAGQLFQYVTNQPPKANSAFHPSGVGKWVPASAGKAKAGMVHSDSGWTWGVQVKLRSLENACHTWAP